MKHSSRDFYYSLLCVLGYSLGVGAGASAATRYTYLAATGVQAVPTAMPVDQTGPADLSVDVDVAAIHQDFYGLPWAAFETGESPNLPASWVSRMDALQAGASGRPMFLSLQLVGGQSALGIRTLLADDYVKDRVVSGWEGATCYDFTRATDSARRARAYVNYVTYMVRKFHPRWINYAIEVNLFQMGCPASAWQGLVAVMNAAYSAAKAAEPGVIAFPSFQNEHLLGYPPFCKGDQQRCFDANYAALSGLKRDRMALSVYPYFSPALTHPGDLPADHLTRAATRGGETVVIAETGWSSAAVSARLPSGQCTSVQAWSETDEATYLDWLFRQSEGAKIDLLSWWSDRDAIPARVEDHCFAAPCRADVWCGLVTAVNPTGKGFVSEVMIKYFGNMGLRDYEGGEKSAVLQRWRSFRALPVARP